MTDTNRSHAAPAALEINTFDANGGRTAQVFTNGDADFRIVGPGVTIDVKRAVTPAFLDRAERAAVNAMVQANRAETQAATATDRAAAAEIAASTIAGLAEAAKKPARRKTTRGKR